MINTERNSRRSLDSRLGSLAGLVLKKCKTVTEIGGVLSRTLRVEDIYLLLLRRLRVCS